ncbi:MAG: hypothetical protein WCG29_04400 [Desulfomonile sp.]|nr:hypothetical protein [Deltaproteobacteria bacterium]
MILSSIVSIFHERINPTGLRFVNRVSGTIIALFGLRVLLSILATVY